MYKKQISISVKEDGSLVGEMLIATTHPDRAGSEGFAGDIFTPNALVQMRDCINDETKVGGDQGSYRLLSLFHDWTREKEPGLPPAGFMSNAEVISLDDGFKGLKVNYELNKAYKGKYTPEEIKYMIEKGEIGGGSVEYKEDPNKTKAITLKGKPYRVIDGLSEFAGAGFARARLIGNPHAIIIKEIEDALAEDKMQDTPTPEINNSIATKELELTKKAAELEAKETDLKKQAEEVALKIKEADSKKLTVKEILDDPSFKEMIKGATEVPSKPIKTKEGHMPEMPISVKEMKESLAKNDLPSYKEAALRHIAQYDASLRQAYMTHGIPLNSTIQVKCEGNKLRMVGGIQVKDTLDTATNTTSYTQSPVEFADIYNTGLIETFNSQANLLGFMPKRDHNMAGPNWGWRIKTDQASSLAVDPDTVAINKDAVNKVKLQTGLKEYRIGVSVSDFTLHNSRASFGDLFASEVQGRMNDLMRDINNDMFTAQGLETQNKVIGLQYVADAATNTVLYGLTRSTANRLAPATATDTYTSVSGAIITANLRLAMTAVEKEGAMRGNLFMVMNPTQRDKIFALEAGNQNYFNNSAVLGFEGSFRYDGVPVLVDSSCQTDSIYVIDKESAYIVISRPPTVIGLARVGAAEEAYISVYLATVYEQPRRIYQLDTLT